MYLYSNFMYLFLWGVYWYMTVCEGENHKAMLSFSIECGSQTLISLWFLMYFALAKCNIVFRSSLLNSVRCTDLSYCRSWCTV